MTSVDLLNARHTPWNTIQTENFICAVAETLARMSRDLPDPSTDFADMVNALDNLVILLNNTSPDAAPEYYFDLEGFGHFKECYYLSPHFVLKFCAERNPTREERKLLQDAKENGMDHLFVPSEYIELPYTIASTNLEKDDDEAEVYDEELCEWGPNPEWHDNTVLTHICIQARVSPLGYNNDDLIPEVNVPYLWDVTSEYLSLSDEEDPRAWAGLNGCTLPWVKAVINRYGINFTKQFAAFCAEYHVWDLHADNVGFTLSAAGGKSIPVILDWMSRQTIPNAVLCHNLNNNCPQLYEKNFCDIIYTESEERSNPSNHKPPPKLSAFSTEGNRKLHAEAVDPQYLAERIKRQSRAAG